MQHLTWDFLFKCRLGYGIYLGIVEYVIQRIVLFLYLCGA